MYVLLYCGVCTGVRRLPPGENPIAVGNNNNNNNNNNNIIYLSESRTKQRIYQSAYMAVRLPSRGLMCLHKLTTGWVDLNVIIKLLVLCAERLTSVSLEALTAVLLKVNYSG
jgi:hypothetical protein